MKHKFNQRYVFTKMLFSFIDNNIDAINKMHSHRAKMTTIKENVMPVYLFPGQGSQKKGMGQGLFEEFPELTGQADAILGYSVAELCLQDAESKLSQTEYTQPALYVVDCLSYERKIRENSGKKPTWVAGHSLGEYAALYAASGFDFATGLKLVKKRGEIMAKATGGGMAAVIGMTPAHIADLLKEKHLDAIDIANLNTHTQVVISGKKEDILGAKKIFEDAGCMMYIPLNVSGAFHSRYMTSASEEFKAYIDQFTLHTPQIPVIANLTALPYEPGQEKTTLVQQIDHSVKWTETIEYLLGKGETEFVEVGVGNVLTGMVAKIRG